MHPTSLFAFFLIQLIAVASPGIDFYMITKVSLSHGYKNGIAAAMGICIANAIYLILTFCGLGFLAETFPLALKIISISGALYLFYIGIQCLKSKGIDSLIETKANNTTLLRSSFLKGFLVSITNPKVFIYFTSVLTQFIPIQSPLNIKIAVLLIVIGTAGGWFSFVSVFISHRLIRNQFIRASKWIDRILAFVFFGLSLKILFN